MAHDVRLVIEYFYEDRGARPLPPNVPAYLCPSILVNGKPGGHYTPGAETKVDVTVKNDGTWGGDAVWTLKVWWAGATTANTWQSVLFGKTDMLVQGTNHPTMTVKGVIPVTAPKHVCLFVSVSTPDDPENPGGVPGLDRKWAQLNLADVSAAVGADFGYEFDVTNPYNEKTTFDVISRPAKPDTVGAIERILQTAVSHQPQLSHTLFDTVAGGNPTPSDPATSEAAIRNVALSPYERRRYKIAAHVADGNSAGDKIAFEVLQCAKGSAAAVGSVGLIVTLEA